MKKILETDLLSFYRSLTKAPAQPKNTCSVSALSFSGHYNDQLKPLDRICIYLGCPLLLHSASCYTFQSPSSLSKTKIHHRTVLQGFIQLTKNIECN